MNDASPDAYGALVDRLLASPRYGERWARPWLDLARYADTNGYEKDQRRTAWKYRDWVIDAFNRDLSFRDFTIEQLAGDMLKDATVEQKIATGFHRNSQLNQEGGIDVEEYRFETLVDRVATTADRVAGQHARVRAVPQPQVRPVPAGRTTTASWPSSTTPSTRSTARARRWWTSGSSSPSSSCATPEQARRREALRREAEALRFELETTDLAAELAAFETRDLRAGCGLHDPRSSATSRRRAARRRNARRRVAAASGQARGQGHLHGHGAHAPRRDHGLPPRGAADPLLPQQGPGRESSGAFVLSALSVKDGERPLRLERAVADVEREGPGRGARHRLPCLRPAGA